MSYKPTAWVDHVNSGNIYNINENSDGTKEIVYAGEVLQKGTPMSAENFNHMETGIETADQTASAALTAVNIFTPKFKNMESDISELQETVQSNADTIGVHENKIAVLSNNVSGIQTGLSATAERVSEVENDLSSLQSTVHTNATNIGVHENEITVLTNNVSSLSTGMEATVTRVSELEETVESMANTGVDLSDYYNKTEVDTKISSVNDDISELESRADANDTVVGNLSNALNNAVFESDIDTEFSSASTNPVQNKVIYNRLYSIDSQVTQLQGKVQTNITDISDLQENISSINTAVGKNQSNIGINTTEIGYLKNNVSSLQSGLSATSNSLSNTVTRVSELEEAVAINKSSIGMQKKNLLKLKYSAGYSYTNTGKSVTWTFNDDYSITMSTSATISSGQSFEYATVTLQPGIYIYSVEGYPTTSVIHTQLYLNGSWNANLSAVENTIIVTEKSVYSFKLYRNSAVSSGTSVTLFPMLRYADVTDSTFEPYTESLQEQIDKLLARIEILENA